MFHSYAHDPAHKERIRAEVPTYTQFGLGTSYTILYSNYIEVKESEAPKNVPM